MQKTDMKVWQHPVLSKIVEILEIFSIEPGDGRLAAYIILASEELIKNLEHNNSAPNQEEILTSIRDRTFEWLKNQVDSTAYNPEPSKSTNQIDKALNCGLLLFCAQKLEYQLPIQTQTKINAYLAYISDQNWPQDNLSPFIASQIKGNFDYIEKAKQYLSNKIDTWRAAANIKGISFILIRLKEKLENSKCEALIATIQDKISTSSLEEKAWALLALTEIDDFDKNKLNKLADSIVDELSKDRFSNNKISKTLLVLNQFPFCNPNEMEHHINILKQRNYKPAKNIVKISKEGILIDFFDNPTDETWCFALQASQVVFSLYVLIKTGYHEIVGIPSYYRSQLEESIEQYNDLINKKQTTIPHIYRIVYNSFAVIITLEIGTIIGAVVSHLRDTNWGTGAIGGFIIASIFSIFNAVKYEFYIIGMFDWLIKQIKKFIGI